MPIIIAGNELKNILLEDLRLHEDYLPLNFRIMIQDFADGVISENNYSLFSCIAELLLLSDREVGPLIAELMKVADLEVGILDSHTFNGLGSYISDFMKKQECIQYFKALNNFRSE